MAVVAFRRLQLNDFYELAPYAIAFAAVPTLACAAGREPLPAWPVLPLTHQQLLANLLARSAHGKERCVRRLFPRRHRCLPPRLALALGRLRFPLPSP